MVVMKFGGSSVSTKKNIANFKSIVAKKNENYIVVVSALSGITDKLEQIANQALLGNSSELVEELKAIHLKLIRELFLSLHQTEVIIYVQYKCNELESISKSIETLKELSDRTKAYLLSFGEQLSSFILHKYLQQEGIDIEHLDSRKLIFTSCGYLNAEVDFKRTEEEIEKRLAQKRYIAGGFIATNSNNETVVLGRGGSDYSAAIYANATNAKSIEIWSDVNGIHSANPNVVKNTVSIQELSYEEAFELAYFGAKVLCPLAIQPLMNKNIPLYLKNTMYPEQKGTCICNSGYENAHKIQGVSSLAGIDVLTVSGIGLARKKGIAHKLFQAMEEKNVNVILISQSCSEQSICIGIEKSATECAKKAIEATFNTEILNGRMNRVQISDDHSIIAVIGDKMKDKSGLSGKIFGALGENGINITAIAQGASERNISIVVHKADEAKAIHVIHEKFFNKITKEIHLFIAGVGNVGTAFLEMIEQQKEHLIKKYQLHLKLIGVVNSKKMLFDEDGLTNQEVAVLNETGVSYSCFNDFVTKLTSYNLRNSIFIDNTASDKVSNSYQLLLEKSISIITCNKIACSSDYSTYHQLLQSSKEYNCHFKYETTVGAALPVIKTIHDLLISGDRIHKIEAVISGSLNFIFNEYNAQQAFADIVFRAKEENYTEPNPMVDLSGLDVMRKILILSREAGFNKEMEEIKFSSFLPQACFDAENIDSFFDALRKHESHFKTIYQQAVEKGSKLKVIAALEQGELLVGLKEVHPESPFYNLKGKDNVIAIHTDRYSEEPIVIKGAGAGVAVTASGVFADLMSVVNN